MSAPISTRCDACDAPPGANDALSLCLQLWAHEGRVLPPIAMRLCSQCAGKSGPERRALPGMQRSLAAAETRAVAQAPDEHPK